MSSRNNLFLNGPLGSIDAKTALPIIFVMGMNGLLAVTDALFLGRFAGPDALAERGLIYLRVTALASPWVEAPHSCSALQAGMTVVAPWIRAAFVSDPIVIAEVARILPMISAGFFLAGPLMMIAMRFQAIGDAARSALLGLAKPYLFAIPLTFLLSGRLDEPGVSLAAPIAEALLLRLTAAVLSRLAHRDALRLGLFHGDEGARA